MHREVVPAADPEKTVVLDYPVRFIPSVQDGAVVADRGFNQANLETALHRTGDAATTAASEKSSVVQSYSWTETNPNDLRLVLRDGTQKEIKVTKRAAETTDDNAFSSEFQRVTTSDANDGRGGIPAIAARRVLTKWRVMGESRIEGLELVYSADSGGGSGDPLALRVEQQREPARLLLKSRLVLERPQTANTGG